MKVLTVKEVADILKIHPRTVTKMVRSGEIPATRIGRVWRFDESAILGWFNARVANGSKNGIEENGAPRIWNGATCVSDLLQENLVQYTGERKGKPDVLESLAAMAVRTPQIHDYEHLLSSLTEREAMCSTAVDGGIAFPHPRHPFDHLEKPVLSVLVSRHGVEFGAPDGAPTRIFVLVCSPDDRSHVKMLAHLVRLFRPSDAVARLAQSHTPTQILKEMKYLEKQVLSRVH